jgi:hypothetical protein
MASGYSITIQVATTSAVPFDPGHVDVVVNTPEGSTYAGFGPNARPLQTVRTGPSTNVTNVRTVRIVPPTDGKAPQPYEEGGPGFISVARSGNHEEGLPAGVTSMTPSFVGLVGKYLYIPLLLAAAYSTIYGYLLVETARRDIRNQAYTVYPNRATRFWANVILRERFTKRDPLVFIYILSLAAIPIIAMCFVALMGSHH